MILAFSIFLALLLIGMPVVFVLGLAAAATLVITQPDIPLTIVAQRMYDGLNSFTIMAIPFFVFAGAIMDAGGISRRIVDLATALVGWIVGSLLMVSVVAATGLAAISGSGSADVAAISSIMQPELRRRRYDVDFSAAVIACAGSLAQIIPPSLMMVIVALVSNLSVGAMFLAGVLPGLLTVPGLLASAYLHARRGGPQYRDTEPFHFARLRRAFWASLPALGMPVIIIGGIVGGVFTPTEAASVAVLYGLVVALFVYRDLTWRELPGLVLRASALSAAVMMIVATASIFGWLVASANVPAMLAAWIKSVSSEPWTYLLMVNVLLMLVGMFMGEPRRDPDPGAGADADRRLLRHRPRALRGRGCHELRHRDGHPALRDHPLRRLEHCGAQHPPGGPPDHVAVGDDDPHPDPRHLRAGHRAVPAETRRPPLTARRPPSAGSRTERGRIGVKVGFGLRRRRG